MHIVAHIIVTAALAALLWPHYGALSLAVFITGVLTDIDHLTEYFKFHKNLSYKKIAHFYRTTEFNNIIQVFHTVEFLLLFLLLSFTHAVFGIMLLGFAIHWLMDFIYQIRNGYLHHRAFSIVVWVFTRQSARSVPAAMENMPESRNEEMQS